jgi:hypothetical protein
MKRATKTSRWISTHGTHAPKFRTFGAQEDFVMWTKRESRIFVLQVYGRLNQHDPTGLAKKAVVHRVLLKVLAVCDTDFIEVFKIIVIIARRL